MPIPNAKELLEDRIKFKFYSAEKHLKNLQAFQKTENISSSLETRVKWEEEIECFLHQLIGAKDALLVRINEKLSLGLALDDVNLGAINDKLNLFHKNSLLRHLNKLVSKKGSWFWNLNELRNMGTHKGLINIQVGVDIVDDVNRGTTSSDVKVSFVIDTSKEIIPYLEYCTQKMKKLIENILKNLQ